MLRFPSPQTKRPPGAIPFDVELNDDGLREDFFLSGAAAMISPAFSLGLGSEGGVGTKRVSFSPLYFFIGGGGGGNGFIVDVTPVSAGPNFSTTSSSPIRSVENLRTICASCSSI